MMTITYEYEGSLYVNLTNKCDCACVFCLRHNGSKGSIYADDLWLEHEPTREEILEDFLKRDLTKYRQIVFCGFGEPMFRWDDDAWIIDELKARGLQLPPVRINTNGHANRILGRDMTPELAGRVDVVSVSLNGASEEEYTAITVPSTGKDGWEDMLDFTKKAARHVPKVVMTIVNKDKTEEDIQHCRELAESLGATLRVREYIPN